MKALAINQYGSAEQFQLMELARPVAKGHDVLIKVHATSVNPFDTGVRKGGHKSWLHHSFPLTIGLDVAGTIVEVGENVTEFRVGDKVFSGTDPRRQGASAEFMVINENLLSLIPENLSFVEAASIPAAGITSYAYLVDFAGIKENDLILIHGGSGGVGSFAIQLAKTFGAHVTTTTSTKNVELVKGLGADEVIDYTKEDFSIRENQFDIVFDTVGGETHEKSYRVTKPNGILMTIVARANEELAKKKNIRTGRINSNTSGKRLSEIADLLEKGYIKPVIGTVLPLEKIAEAHLLSETGHARGKIVLEVN